jgi:hypothetical protein
VEYVKDMFLTESFLVKGLVRNGAKRLSTFLNSSTAPFIEVHDATLIGVTQGDRIVTARAMIHRNEILLAHELIEAAGDATLKSLAASADDRTLVNLYFSGRLPIEVSGKMLKRAYNRKDLGEQKFLVVTEPSIEGLGGKKAREFSVLTRAPYLIVNRDRIAYVFDYTP